jgi:hypothetical protein
MNFIRVGFIPTNGFDRESHHDDASDENLSTSHGSALSLSFPPPPPSILFPLELTSPSIEDDDDDDDEKANAEKWLEELR